MTAKELELGTVRAALEKAMPAGFQGTAGEREPAAKVGKATIGKFDNIRLSATMAGKVLGVSRAGAAMAGKPIVVSRVAAAMVGKALP